LDEEAHDSLLDAEIERLLSREVTLTQASHSPPILGRYSQALRIRNKYEGVPRSDIRSAWDRERIAMEEEVTEYVVRTTGLVELALTMARAYGKICKGEAHALQWGAMKDEYWCLQTLCEEIKVWTDLAPCLTVGGRIVPMEGSWARAPRGLMPSEVHRVDSLLTLAKGPVRHSGLPGFSPSPVHHLAFIDPRAQDGYLVSYSDLWFGEQCLRVVFPRYCRAPDTIIPLLEFCTSQAGSERGWIQAVRMFGQGTIDEDELIAVFGRMAGSPPFPGLGGVVKALYGPPGHQADLDVADRVGQHILLTRFSGGKLSANTRLGPLEYSTRELRVASEIFSAGVLKAGIGALAAGDFAGRVLDRLPVMGGWIGRVIAGAKLGAGLSVVGGAGLSAAAVTERIVCTPISMVVSIAPIDGHVGPAAASAGPMAHDTEPVFYTCLIQCVNDTTKYAHIPTYSKMAYLLDRPLLVNMSAVCLLEKLGVKSREVARAALGTDSSLRWPSDQVERCMQDTLDWCIVAKLLAVQSRCSHCPQALGGAFGSGAHAHIANKVTDRSWVTDVCPLDFA